MKTQLLRFDGTVARAPAIEFWLQHQPPGLGALARQWFEAMRACGPEVREILHDGHPTACVGDAGFGYVDTFKDHVNVGFFRGASLPDPAGLLEGSGKAMRHVKVRRDTPVDASNLAKLVTAAYADMRARVQAEAARQQ